MKSKYIPVDPHFFDLFKKEMAKGEAKVIYFAFSEEPELEESKSNIVNIDAFQNEGEHLFMENGDKVRLDRIVVINGKPGPAYDEYDSYALAPLTCQAGYSDCNL